MDRDEVIKTLQGIRIALDMDGHHNDAQAVADALAFLREQHEELVRLQRSKNWAPRNKEADDER